MKMNVVTITTVPIKEGSIPLGTLMVQTVLNGLGPDPWTVYNSVREIIGAETAKGIAFQAFNGTVLFYGNVISPLLGRLSLLGEALIPWCREMNIPAAWASVLYFTLMPPLLLDAPFLEGERDAAACVNRTLDSAGFLMRQGDAVGSRNVQFAMIFGGPPPPWFMGMGINSTTRENIGRSQP
jgi:hypothetical protein